LETIYDWVTVAIFAGLVVLFLQRSTAEEPSDRLIDYLPPALGCAVANWLGNNGYPLFAVLAIVAVGAYTWYVLKPLAR
jgi:hypothetical protein